MYARLCHHELRDESSSGVRGNVETQLAMPDNFNEERFCILSDLKSLSGNQVDLIDYKELGLLITDLISIPVSADHKNLKRRNMILKCASLITSQRAGFSQHERARDLLRLFWVTTGR